MKSRVFIGQVLRLPGSFPVDTAPEPFPVHLQTRLEILACDRFKGPGRIVLQEAVDVVALGVELFPLEICQAVNIIEVVIAVSGVHKLESAWEELAQLLHLLGGKTDDLKGDPPLGGIRPQGPKNSGSIPLTGGEKVALPRAALDPVQQEAVQLGDLMVIHVLP